MNGFWVDFKRVFMRGLAALMPTVVTIAIFAWAFNWINGNVAKPITDLIITYLPYPDEVPGFFENYFETNSVEDALLYGQPVDRLDPNTGRQLTLEYLTIHHEQIKKAIDSDDPKVAKRAKELRGRAMWQIAFRKWRLNIIGFVIAIVLVYIVGYFISGLLGGTARRAAEALMFRMPLVRSVYPNIKQVTDFLLGDRQFDFSGVVAVEYPRKGVWSMGLVTGSPMTSIAKRESAQDLITVFIPSSPTPVTGYTITVPRTDVIDLELSIDEALRFAISGGVIKPPSEGGQPEMAMEDTHSWARLLGRKPEELDADNKT